MNYTMQQQIENVDWEEASELYRIAPLGNKSPEHLRTVFTNSRIRCFIYEADKLIAAGRVLSDGADCAYICDVVVHPDYQGTGLGKQLIQHLVDLSKEHKKIILYANPGKEGFYRRFGFRKMNTAMAIFQNQDGAIRSGLLSAE